MEIFKLILSKAMYGILVVVLVTMAITSLIFLGQVDPTRLTFGQRADVATVESKRMQLGLDDSLPIQLARYLGDLSPIQRIKADRFKKVPYAYRTIGRSNENIWLVKAPYLRESYQTGKSVKQLIFDAFPVTLILAISSFSFALLFSIIFGVFAALYFNSWWDKLIIAFTSVGYSLPSYVVAIIVAIIFGYYLQAFTGLNIQGSIYELDELGNDVIMWKNLILPALALGIRPMAVITQITRSSVLDILSAPYVRTAEAKGLSSVKIIIRHVLPNSLNPIGTAVSGWFASLLAGAFFVETVFNFKGLGSLTVNALLSYDLPLILGCIIFTSVLFVFINIATDIFYLIVDPRLRK